MVIKYSRSFLGKCVLFAFCPAFYNCKSLDRVNTSPARHRLIPPVPVVVFFRLQDGCRVVDNFVLFEKETLLQEAKILIHRINLQREIYGEFYHLVNEVLIAEEKCLSYIRMRPCTFHSLLDLIAPYITIRETNFRKPTPASISASVSIFN